jgi:hypothetical protein
VHRNLSPLVCGDEVTCVLLLFKSWLGGVCSKIWLEGRCVGTRGREEQEGGENWVMRGDIICTLN